MNETELKALLARNPQITAIDNKTLRPILAQEPERRAANTLEESQRGNASGQTIPFVLFIFRRIQLLDADAIAGSGKDLLDGLQDAGLIFGDSEDQICYEAIQQKVGRKRDEGTLIFVATGAEADRLIRAKQAYRTTLLTTLTQ